MTTSHSLEGSDGTSDDDGESGFDSGSTSQGDVALVRVKIDGAYVNAVRKTSKYVDNIMELEEAAMTRVNKLGMPFYAELLAAEYDDATTRVALYTRQVYHVNPCTAFADESADVEARALMNFAFQTCAAARVMHERLGISHGDLHTSNVLMQKCVADINVFAFADDDCYAIKTYGVAPVIIDFGYAYVPDERMMMSADFTNVGYFPMDMDALADARLFLVGTIEALGARESSRVAELECVKEFTYATINALLPMYCSPDKMRAVVLPAMDKLFLDTMYEGKRAIADEKAYGIFKGRYAKDAFDALFYSIRSDDNASNERMGSESNRAIVERARRLFGRYVVEHACATFAEMIHIAFHEFIAQWRRVQYSKLVGKKQSMVLAHVLDTIPAQAPTSRVHAALDDLLACARLFALEVRAATRDDRGRERVLSESLPQETDFRRRLLDEIDSRTITTNGWFSSKAFTDLMDALKSALYDTLSVEERRALAVFDFDSTYWSEAIGLLLARVRLPLRFHEVYPMDPKNAEDDASRCRRASSAAFKAFAAEWVRAQAHTAEPSNQVQFLKLLLNTDDVDRFAARIPTIAALKASSTVVIDAIARIVRDVGRPMVDAKNERYARAGIASMKEMLARLPLRDETIVNDGDVVDVHFCGSAQTSSIRLRATRDETVADFLAYHVRRKSPSDQHR